MNVSLIDTSSSSRRILKRKTIQSTYWPLTSFVEAELPAEDKPGMGHHRNVILDLALGASQDGAWVIGVDMDLCTC